MGELHRRTGRCRMSLPTLTLHVTREDAERAGPWENSGECLLGTSARRQFPGCYPVGDMVHIDGAGYYYGEDKVDAEETVNGLVFDAYDLSLCHIDLSRFKPFTVTLTPVEGQE